MKIDGNELAIEQNELDREGRHTEAMAIKRLRSSWNSCVRCVSPATTAPARKNAPTTATALSA